MQYLVMGLDGKDMFEERARVRPRHLENMANVKEYGSIICAGGIKDEEGRTKGSVMIMEFADKELLDRYLASEPYILENVWEEVRVDPYNVVIVNDVKVGK
jgi:uncharacterized protein YciI